MSELDDKIRQALNETGIEAEQFEEEEDSLRTLIADAYSGKLRWMGILATFWQLVFFVIWVYAAVQFFQIADGDPQIFWATIFLMTGMMVSMIKMMHWMMINRNRVVREVKRLELEGARLGKKLSS